LSELIGRAAGLSRIPAGPFWLGWAGVLPFAAFAAASVAAAPLPIDPLPVLVGYGCVILSFMGGAQWGLATRDPGGLVTRFAASVVPALVAWPALLLAPRLALAVLIAGFAGLCAYDLWTVRKGGAPRWYGRLRLQLTAAVVLVLLAAFLAVPRTA
jgi:hypothetical protein